LSAVLERNGAMGAMVRCQAAETKPRSTDHTEGHEIDA
jgi:hypothetical protein